MQFWTLSAAALLGGGGTRARFRPAWVAGCGPVSARQRVEGLARAVFSLFVSEEGRAACGCRVRSAPTCVAGAAHRAPGACGAHCRGPRCSLSREHTRPSPPGAQSRERQRARQRKMHPEEPLRCILHVQKSPWSGPRKQNQVSSELRPLETQGLPLSHQSQLLNSVTPSALSFTLCLGTGF